MSDGLKETNCSSDVTTSFSLSDGCRSDVFSCLSDVCRALSERGYDPVSQIVGYVMSGDPVYITSHCAARSKISMFSREDLLTSLVEFFLNHYG